MSEGEKSWNTPWLNKGEEITTSIKGYNLAISHIDRTIDPYLSFVLKNGTVIASGLCPTLSDARRFCAKHIQD